MDYLNEYRVLIDADGTVYMLAPAIIVFTCKLDVTYFPYDRQLCRVRFTSWSYTGTQLDLRNSSDSADLTVFVDNGVWNVLGMPVRRLVRTYPCCDDPFVEMVYFIVLERQYLYYVFNLVLPAVFITCMSLLVFYLPAESGEKISLGITVLLSICVFLLMVSEQMPATSETVPLIGKKLENCGLGQIDYSNHLLPCIQSTL